MVTRLEKPVVLAFVKRLWQPLQKLQQHKHKELLRAGVGHLKAVVRLQPLQLLTRPHWLASDTGMTARSLG